MQGAELCVVLVFKAIKGGCLKNADTLCKHFLLLQRKKCAHENVNLYIYLSQDCPWGKKDIDANQMPNTAKLLRLAFHDCAPYLAADGSTYGGKTLLVLHRIRDLNHFICKGCDGCINWAGMGFGYSGFPGGTDYLVKDYYPEDKLTFGNNNGLQVFRKNQVYKVFKGKIIFLYFPCHS